MKEEIKLRAHHIGKIKCYHDNPEVFGLSDEEFIAQEREGIPDSYPADFYSDEWILHMRDTVKGLLENPDLKFTYVDGLDSLCRECKHDHECGNPEHMFYAHVNKFDEQYAPPEMKVGQEYDAKYVLDLCKRMGWLE